MSSGKGVLSKLKTAAKVLAGMAVGSIVLATVELQKFRKRARDAGVDDVEEPGIKTALEDAKTATKLLFKRRGSGNGDKPKKITKAQKAALDEALKPENLEQLEKLVQELKVDSDDEDDEEIMEFTGAKTKMSKKLKSRLSPIEEEEEEPSRKKAKKGSGMSNRNDALAGLGSYLFM